jgi:uncharacterized membrane protein YccF (DUF307 family)
MTLLGNILWFLFGGLWSFIGYSIGGLLACLTVVGIPFGLQMFKLGVASLAPFGKDIYEVPNANSSLRVILNVLWIVLFGWEMVLAHLSLALGCAVTIIGIPFAVQHLKLVPLSLLPFGRELR